MDRASGERMRQIFEEVKSWGRWGADDERGALNLITPDRVVHASSLVTTGQVVSCAHDLSAEPSAENTSPALHMMTSAGDALDLCVLPGLEQTTDFLGVACHGLFISHIDALCHVFVGGVMYNGFTANEVKSVGAMRNSIGAAAMGVHLLDNLALGELLEACARIGRWEFLFTCEPLRAPRATGSPVNPVAVL